MIIRKLDPCEAHGEDGWMVAIEGKREVIRFKPPPGGFSTVDVERLREQLLKLAEEMRFGPS